MRFGVMTFSAINRFRRRDFRKNLVMVPMVLLALASLAFEANAEDWRTVELVRTGEMSDTSAPLFQGKDEQGPFGRSKVTLRCADEGWGNVSIERVRGRFALDHQLGLKSWPEVTKALQKNSDAYLRGERMKFREIFVQDDAGPVHPRDELAAFGDSEKGYKYKFAKFDECAKVDSETLKPDQTCVVTLQVKDTAKKNAASGHVRYRSIKCTPLANAAGSNATPTEVPQAAPSGSGGTRKKTTTP